MDHFSPDFSVLSPRERECLRLYADRTVKEVGAELGISPDTVKTHLAAARSKLDGMRAKEASRLLRDLERGHPNGSSPERGMPEGRQGSAWELPPAHPTGAGKDRLSVREERVAFVGPSRLAPAYEAPHDLKPARKVAAALLATLVIAVVILLIVAIFGGIDRILPRFYPGFHPS